MLAVHNSGQPLCNLQCISSLVWEQQQRGPCVKSEAAIGRGGRLHPAANLRADTGGHTGGSLCGGTASRLTCSRVAQAVRIGGATKKGCQKRTSAFFSRTCTSRPCRARRPAVARPPTPAPITTTFRPLAAAARMTRRAARLPWPRSGGRQEGFAVPSALQAHFMPCMIYADVVCDRDWPGTRSQRLHESCLAWRDGQ